MIITVAAFKGGVGKTTTSIHLAAYMAKRGKTVLVDGDMNRSASRQARRGGFPFEVWDERRIAMAVREHEHVVIDTEARPGPEDLEELAAGCDLLVLPSTPDVMTMEALFLTAEAVSKAGGEDRYKVLLTLIPPPPSRHRPNRRAVEPPAGGLRPRLRRGGSRKRGQGPEGRGGLGLLRGRGQGGGRRRMSERPSRFSGLRESVLGEGGEGGPAPPSGTGRGGRPGRRRGRPPGKRSNPDYVQLTCYVREENLDDAKEALIQEKRETGRKRDVSDVIDSLLAFYAREGDPWARIGNGRA